MSHGNHSYIAYIDESGDEGFVFDRNDGKKNGSSHWFVLSALLVRRVNSNVTVELADNIRKAIGIPERKSIHFKEIRNHHKKLKALEVLMTGKIKHITILVHKPSLHERETFSVKNTLYFYTARYLLERISWFCRDNRMSKDKHDGSVRVVFSNRASTPYDKFKDYISHIIGSNCSSIAPGIIRPEQIEAINHNNSAGLQLVDLVASSFFSGVEEFYGVTEPHFAVLLLPRAYARDGKKMKYGFKIVPTDCWPSLAQLKGLKWIAEHIKE